MKKDLFANEMASFVMGLKEAQDLFSKVGNLSIVKVKGKPALRLKSKVHGWTIHFWKAIPGSLKTTFCDLETGHYIAKELGFKPNDTTEVSMLLVGEESVMVKVFDTNTRPAGFAEEQPIIDALEMGFELGCEDGAFYLHYNGRSYLNEGDEIKGEYKRNFLRFVYLTDPNPDPVWLDQWEVRIKKITLSKVICCCTQVAGYSVLLDKD